MDPFDAMSERAGEIDNHYAGPSSTLTRGNINPQKVHHISFHITYGCGRSQWTGNVYSSNGGAHMEPTISAGSRRRITETRNLTLT